MTFGALLKQAKRLGVWDELCTSLLCDSRVDRVYGRDHGFGWGSGESGELEAGLCAVERREKAVALADEKRKLWSILLHGPVLWSELQELLTCSSRIRDWALSLLPIYIERCDICGKELVWWRTPSDRWQVLAGVYCHTCADLPANTWHQKRRRGAPARPKIGALLISHPISDEERAAYCPRYRRQMARQQDAGR